MREMIPLPIRCEVVDCATGAVVEDTNATAMMMPARAGTCEMCATAHEPDQPHNAGSLFYQMRFNAQHGRYPDWRDAMAHCSDALRAQVTAALVELGVDVEAGALRPGGQGHPA